MNQMKRATTKSCFDRPPTNATLDQLLPRHHPMLPFGKRSDHRIHRLSLVFAVT